jgi:pimeloyl-ACP methyl ester carboxylesterase
VGTDPPLVVLVPSPLLGPAVWSRVADRLRRHGRDVLVPAPYPQLSAPVDVLDHLCREIPADLPVTLVPHSNAGLYVAALAAARDVTGIVLVDAGMPSDGPTTPTAPPYFRDFVASLVEPDGSLPVWTCWWAEADVAGLFPDDAARAAVEAEQLRLPSAYFDAEIPSPAGWRDLPASYLSFGDTYEAERDVAERRGWSVERLDGDHLHMLVDPDAVTDALDRMLRVVQE